MTLFVLMCQNCQKTTEKWERYQDVKENKVLCECGTPFHIVPQPTRTIFKGSWAGKHGETYRSEMVVEDLDGKKKVYDIREKGVAKPLG